MLGAISRVYFSHGGVLFFCIVMGFFHHDVGVLCGVD